MHLSVTLNLICDDNILTFERKELILAFRLFNAAFFNTGDPIFGSKSISGGFPLPQNQDG